LRFEAKALRIADVALEPRAIVLTAGEGNAALLARLGVTGEPMQRRALGMVLLRGNLPPLFGHCVVGGKTALTITSPEDGLWQIGGELAEKLARETDDASARCIALNEIHKRLPGIDLGDAEIALYRAVRAEART